MPGCACCWAASEVPRHLCSVQGYGAKGESEGYLYPGSGATVDSRIPFVMKTDDADDADAVMANGIVPPLGEIEDDEEFLSAGLERAPSEDGPHIINVGIAGLHKPDTGASMHSLNARAITMTARDCRLVQVEVLSLNAARSPSLI